jgi:hypothetical protein
MMSVLVCGGSRRYWRSSPHSVLLRTRPNPKASDDPSPSSDSPRNHSADKGRVNCHVMRGWQLCKGGQGPDYCRDRNHGRLCTQCDKGYFQIGSGK